MAAHPGSPVPGILQARTLEWVAISLKLDHTKPQEICFIFYFDILFHFHSIWWLLSLVSKCSGPMSQKKKKVLMSLQILKWLFVLKTQLVLSYFPVSLAFLLEAWEGHPAALYISELKLEVLFNHI